MEALRVEAREQVRVQLLFEEVAAVRAAVAVVDREETAAGDAFLHEVFEAA